MTGGPYVKTIDIELDDESEAIVAQMLADGTYPDEQAVFEAALEALMEAKAWKPDEQ